MHDSRSFALSPVEMLESVKPRRQFGSCVAYIAEPRPTNGGETLFRQKRAIDRYALTRQISAFDYIVDSGSTLVGPGIAHGVHVLLCAVRVGEVRSVVVEHISRFNEDYATALRIAVAMSIWGAAIHEAHGGIASIKQDLASWLLLDESSGQRVDLGPVRSACSRRRPCAAIRHRTTLERTS